jgi:hypothetical protein
MAGTARFHWTLWLAPLLVALTIFGLPLVSMGEGGDGFERTAAVTASAERGEGLGAAREGEDRSPCAWQPSRPASDALPPGDRTDCWRRPLRL